MSPFADGSGTPHPQGRSVRQDASAEPRDDRDARPPLELTDAERLSLALASAQLGDWMWDRATDVVSASPIVAGMLSLDMDQPSMALDAFFAPLASDDRQRLRAAIDRLLTSGVGLDVECRVTLDGSTEKRIVVTGKPVYGSTRTVVGLVGLVQEITGRTIDRERAAHERDQLLEAERAARSEAERASRLKDEFLATLSHELRTPLNAILGWSHMLVAGDRDAADTRRGLDVIARNARAQAQIIDDLLDMSRIISGKIRLNVQAVEIAQILEAAFETARPAADAREIRLHLALDPYAGVVSGDPDRLQQVFWNLLSNAIKFTPRGGRVQAAVDRVDSHVELSVIDTGEGIPPEFLPYVFDRFRQIDSSTTRRHGGLGLGLAIVKQLVEMHGGTVKADSGGKGLGARFTVTLPISAVQTPGGDRRRASGTHAMTQPLEPHPRLDGVSVLVVDDERDAAELVMRVLKESGADTAVATSMSEALECLGRRTFDVMVSDIGMPDADGYTLIRQVRALEGHHRTMPALALTAYARPQDRRRALLSGYQMHASKPVEPTELVIMVASLAGRGGGAT